jgi:hypothetical protein
MDKQKYQQFIMWKATHPGKRKPSSLSAYIQDHELSIDDINTYMNSESYTRDLNRATRFLISSELPDLMWSIYDQVKDKRRGTDLEALTRLLFDPKIKDKSESDNEVFEEFDTNLTEEQKKFFLKSIKSE